MVGFTEYTDKELINYIRSGLSQKVYSIARHHDRSILRYTLYSLEDFSKCEDAMSYYDVRGLTSLYITTLKTVKRYMSTDELQALKQLEDNNA